MGPSEFERDLGRFKQHLRRNLLAGVLILIPSVVTIWVLVWLFSTVDAVLGNLLTQATGIRIPGLGFLLTLLMLYGVGLFASNVGGKRFIAWFEGLMERLPVARGIYKVSKEISLAFGKKDKRPFREVIALEFPRKGLWCLAFLTADVPEGAPAPAGSVYIFIPTTPNPTSGWLLMVPEESVIKTPYSIDEAMRIIISAGIVRTEKDLQDLAAGEVEAEVISRPGRE